ncbi:NUDIX hydrolase [Ciceribacter sp. RN22]|uniref:NUDIX hydrolase n=1 Tax=Ciceribacter sp. RN22 TaxID=2954932 RepID=UPI0035B4369D
MACRQGAVAGAQRSCLSRCLSSHPRVLHEVVEVAPARVIPDLRPFELRTIATVVPVLPVGYILAPRGRRHGRRRTCLSFPGRFPDPGKAVEVAALRKPVEETGFHPRPWPWAILPTAAINMGRHGHHFLFLPAAPPARREGGRGRRARGPGIGRCLSETSRCASPCRWVAPRSPSPDVSGSMKG